MPTRSLPRHPSLEHLRSEARELQHAIQRADPAALQLAQEHHPRFRERIDDFRLADAQLTVARSYGHASWPRLKAYVQTVTQYARDPHEVTPQGDPADEFLRLACLNYGGDDLSRPERAAELLRRDRELSGRSIYTAAATGDAEAAARMLAVDPSVATTPGGPHHWEPLLYVTYSRLVSDDPRHSHLAVARLLLEHGADPNAGYLWDAAYLFTALTGAFGYGEDAPNQPPHPQSIPLARLLLDAGADPNDDQTIYNRHFRTDNDYLELLLAYGLGKAPRRGPWPHRLGDHLAPPKLLAEDALVFVADNDAYSERVALLLAHDVDPDGRGTQHPGLHGQRPIERALLAGAQRNAELLLTAGAQPPGSDAVDALRQAATRGDRSAVERALAADPALASALIERYPAALAEVAERANTAGAAILVRHIGYDPNSKSIGTPALHLAAFQGDRTMCELLIELGADPSLEDDHFNAPAAGWARHAHHDDLAHWLQELT